MFDVLAFPLIYVVYASGGSHTNDKNLNCIPTSLFLGRKERRFCRPFRIIRSEGTTSKILNLLILGDYKLVLRDRGLNRESRYYFQTQSCL